MKTTFYLALYDGERSMIICSLNRLKNSLIEQGKYTDAINDILVKVIGTKKKKFKSPMEWVQKMNNILNCVTEIVNNEVIFK